MLANHPTGQAPMVENRTINSSVPSIRFLKMPFQTNITAEPIKRQTEITLKACIIHHTKTDVTPLPK
jgi:hypothetical protein